MFIQSPVFNASPIVEAVLDACKRGVTVTLYIGLGFNDFAEGIVPFQGGTNDSVRYRLMTELSKENKQKYLKWHWYVAKDQNALFDSKNKQEIVMLNSYKSMDKWRSWVTSLILLRLIVGSGNMDTQSWFHSQEVNVMVDSALLVNEWMENFAANQNTGKVWID